MSSAVAFLKSTIASTTALLAPRARAAPFSTGTIVHAANLKKRNGIAAGAVLQARAFADAGFRSTLIDAVGFYPVSPLDPGDLLVVHSPAYSFPAYTALLHPGRDVKRAGYFAWELPDAPPANWLDAENFLDEIWTPSAFSAAPLRRIYKKPVVVVPHIIKSDTPIIERTGDVFSVVSTFDLRSGYDRKNPDAVIVAFKRAFGASERHSLTLKVNGSAESPEGMQRLQATCGDAGNIRILTGYLSDEALARLYRTASAYISLHRAEGFGLPMLEAMCQGLPTIATGWSGNLEFMNEANSILVPYSLVAVEDRSGQYSNSTWADANVDAAAEALRRLSEDPTYWQAMSQEAYRSTRYAAQLQRLDTICAHLTGANARAAGAA